MSQGDNSASCCDCRGISPHKSHLQGSLPIDDHAIVRGHAVFDTCTLAAGRMYRLSIHLQRFLQSARAARIPLPYGDDDAANVRQMAARTLRLRLRLSLSRSRSRDRTRSLALAVAVTLTRCGR